MTGEEPPRDEERAAIDRALWELLVGDTHERDEAGGEKSTLTDSPEAPTIQ